MLKSPPSGMTSGWGRLSTRTTRRFSPPGTTNGVTSKAKAVYPPRCWPTGLPFTSTSATVLAPSKRRKKRRPAADASIGSVRV